MSIDEFRIDRGREFFIGAPQDPQLTPKAKSALASAVSEVRGIQEAHVPQCLIPGVSERPAQVLVLILEPTANADTVMKALGPQLRTVVPSGVVLDVWPISLSNEMVLAVRAAGMEIFRASERSSRPWWRFW